MDSSQAAALAARWRAGTADYGDIARALDELTVALTALERGRAKVDELIAPVRQLRAASDRAQAFLQDTGDKWGH